MGVVDFLEALTSNEVKWWVVHKPDMEFVGYSEFMENANIDVILIQNLEECRRYSYFLNSKNIELRHIVIYVEVYDKLADMISITKCPIPILTVTPLHIKRR